MSRVLFTPTGTVSDAGLLQTAIGNAGPGGRVDITQGRALINAPITLNIQGVTLAGVGPGSVLARAPAYSGQLLELRGAQRSVLKDFHIDDQPSPDVAGALVNNFALFVWNCTDSVFEGIHIRNGFRSGIGIAQCDGVLVHKCIVEDMKGTPPTSAPGQPWAGGMGGQGIITFSNKDKPNCTNIRVIDCTLRRNWRTGVILCRTSQGVVQGCSFIDNMPKPSFDAKVETGGQLAVWLGSNDITLVGNTIIGGYDTQGIEVDITEHNNPPPGGARSSNVTITGNVIREQGRTGLLIFGDAKTLPADRFSRVVVQGNILENCTKLGNGWYGGITVVETMSDFVLSGNMVFEREQAAVKIRGQNRRWLAVGNHLEVAGAPAVDRDNVFFDGNKDDDTGKTTGIVGVGCYVCNGVEV